jgi:hypothetical protein
MKEILRSHPFCQWSIGKAVAYRIASRSTFVPTDMGREMFRNMMRVNAKCAIEYARSRKGAV